MPRPEESPHSQIGRRDRDQLGEVTESLGFVLERLGDRLGRGAEAGGE